MVEKENETPLKTAESVDVKSESGNTDISASSIANYKILLKSFYYSKAYIYWCIGQLILISLLIVYIIVNFFYKDWAYYVVLVIEVFVMICYSLELVTKLMVFGCDAWNNKFFIIDFILYVMCLSAIILMVYRSHLIVVENEDFDAVLLLIRSIIQFARIIFVGFKMKSDNQD